MLNSECLIMADTALGDWQQSAKNGQSANASITGAALLRPAPLARS
ncbi:hypothetical protein [Mariprofundus ferrooxydans]|nr:hypothetical protein [Mariprofundus ferrooxydans]